MQKTYYLYHWNLLHMNKTYFLLSRIGVAKLLFIKGQIANIWGFVGHKISVAVIKLYHYHMKKNREYVNELAWLWSNKTLFTKKYV